MKSILLIMIVFFSVSEVFSQVNWIIIPKISYNFNNIKYESDWKEHITFTKQYSYGLGISFGKIYAISKDTYYSLDVGLDYFKFNLSADVDTSNIINGKKIFNTSFDESYNLISIPIRGILYFPAISSKIIPGIELSLINNFPDLMNSKGSAPLLNGGTKEYEIVVKNYYLSYSLGLILKIPLKHYSFVINGSFLGSLHPLYEIEHSKLSIFGYYLSLQLFVSI
ncbi:MAG: hypothetical protein HW421_2239 [Ignavibacteria bacterium]|nr:hypothetical protein [Ignavibacteria bacterium]